MRLIGWKAHDAGSHVFETFFVNVAIFRAVNSHHAAIADTFFSFYRFLGSGWVILPVVLLVWRWNPGKVKFLLVAIAFESLLVLLLKNFFLQPRPAALLQHVHLLLPLYSHSFPSGDTALAFTIAGSLFMGQAWPYRLLLLSYATLIGYERIYLGVHFPLDVCVGAILGIFAAIATSRMLESNTELIANLRHPVIVRRVGDHNH